MNKEVPYECCGNLFLGRVRKTYVLGGEEGLGFEFKKSLCFGGEEGLCFGDIRKS